METAYSPDIQRVLNRLAQSDRNEEAQELITVCRMYLTRNYPELLTIENFSVQQLAALKEVCNAYLFAQENCVTQYKPEPYVKYLADANTNHSESLLTPAKNDPQHTKKRHPTTKAKRKAAEASRRRNRK